MRDFTPPESRRAGTLALLIALALHIALISISANMQRSPAAYVAAPVSQLFEIEPLPVVQPEPERAPESPAPSRSGHRPALRAARVASAAPAREQPLAQPAPSDPEVLDFGTMLVTGTTNTGTAPSTASSIGHATLGAPATRALTSSTSTSGAGDLSRAPGIAGSAQWRCPFPLAADAAGVDRAQVTLRVDVASDGSVLSAHALDDPGHDFASHARACALRKRLAPALNRAGQPTRASAIIHVTFER
jgi:hypothetical protein